MKKYLLIATAVIAALVGCKKQTQSEVDFADVKQNATVSGQVVFMADEAGKATEEMKMEGVRVYFQVANSEYMTGTDGNKQFSAVTDAEGNFSITVPTGAAGVTGDLLTDMFQGEQAGKTIWFAANEVHKAISLNAGDTKVKKVILEKDEVLSQCTGKGILFGFVKYNGGSVAKGDVKEEGLLPKEGILVKATVDYADATRTFVATTDANGKYSFELPLLEGVNDAELAIKQFKADFTEWSSSAKKYVAYQYYYNTPATAPVASLEDGEEMRVDIIAEKGEKVEEVTTKGLAFIVKGTLTMAAEEFKYDDPSDAEKITNLVKGKMAYTNKFNDGKYEIVLKNTSNDREIVYEAAIDSKDGKYSKEVSIYDDWKIEDVKIYVRVRKFATDQYVHYFQVAKYKTSGAWDSFPGWWQVKEAGKWVDYYSSEKLAGTYELETSAKQYDGFFDVVIDGKLSYTMSEDSKKSMLGVGNTDPDTGKSLDYDADGHQIYGGGLTY